MLKSKHILFKTSVFVLFGILIWACSNNDTPQEPEPTDTSKDRKVLLTHLADNIIIPSYANFKVKFDAMNSKSQAFTAKPDATTLGEFRQAWREAYIEWQKVELFDVGPANRAAMRNFYNIYPTSVAGITQYIADPSVNLEVASSYDKQGFPALDYLLNGVGTTDAETVAFYTNATEGVKRLAYIKRIVDHMNALITKVISDWNGSYREEFTTKTGLDIGSPMGELVNGYVLHYERFIRSGKFGIPSGAMLNGVVAPEKVEAFYKKDISNVLAQTAHQAVVDFFNGKNVKTNAEGPSFKTYLDALGAKDSATGKTLSEIINAQFGVSKSRMDALKSNLYEEVKTNNTAVVQVYTEMQKAVRMLKVDMTAAMSIVITYTDNDGD
ncbi:imelysin family protein [Runella sp. MFBS21]|uniref:imelysin family protein n=1 Tax=Runella sp. MFBS21 TaxID=3034018 RepID=UPI0023F6BBFD|nr:imelysin family protein [Runella sp. MFBS21]MDF7820880.1 imelysin family protein [Runella sp. MFBS21]